MPKLGETSLMLLVDPTIKRNDMVNLYANVISKILKDKSFKSNTINLDLREK